MGDVGGGRAAGLLCGALGCALLSGCVSAFQTHRSALADMHAMGDYEAIERTLDDPAVASLYDEKNGLLWEMDRGAAALALGDLDATIARLNEAEERMAERRGSGALETAGAFLINDTVTTYLGEPYEEMYLNVFKMLAQLEAGRIGGGATVEARRMATKANLLRDEYLRSAATVRKVIEEEAGDAPEASGADGGRYALDSGGNFVESPLGLFLSAAAFLHDGDSNGQRVAARRLQQAIEAQGAMIGPVEGRAFEGMEEWTVPPPGSGRGHLLVVAFSGRGPIKESTRERAYAYGGSAIELDLPVLRWEPSAAEGARVRLDGGGSSPEEHARAGDEVFDLDLVEDLSRVANANHERQMPIIYARTFARVAAKAVGVGAATWGASTANNDAFTAAVLIGGIALLLASEEADTRCWTMLPGQAHVRLIEVPAGRHEATVEWASAASGGGTPGTGTLYASGRRIVDVPEGGLATMVEYWWR